MRNVMKLSLTKIYEIKIILNTCKFFLFIIQKIYKYRKNIHDETVIFGTVRESLRVLGRNAGLVPCVFDIIFRTSFFKVIIEGL